MSPTAGEMLVREIVPRLQSTIPYSVSRFSAEDSEELLQDATALAARLLHNAEASGKQVTPGNIAYYATLHVRSGRRFHSSGTDALGSQTQLCGRSRVSSLDESLGGDAEEPMTLGDVLASEAEDPSETAARNLDWQALVATLDEKALAVLRCMAGEVRLQELANRCGVGRSTVQDRRNRLTDLVCEFMGSEVLKELSHAPRWQENLRAFREQLACRLERRVA